MLPVFCSCDIFCKFLLKLPFTFINSGDSYCNHRVKRVQVSLNWLQHSLLTTSSSPVLSLLLVSSPPAGKSATSIGLAALKIKRSIQNSEQKQNLGTCTTINSTSLVLADFILKKRDSSITDASGCALGQVQVLRLTAPRESSKRENR